MAINETIVTGRKFRKLVDESTKLWQRISIWSKASDVEFDDGKTAETKFGAINGITDSLTSTSSNVAASAAAVKALNDKITELNSNIFDALSDSFYITCNNSMSTGQTTSYVTYDVSPFNTVSIEIFDKSDTGANSPFEITIDDIVIFSCTDHNTISLSFDVSANKTLSLCAKAPVGSSHGLHIKDGTIMRFK